MELPAAPSPTLPPPANARTREQIKKTAHDFEAAFIGQMLNQMFEGVETAKPFGGGAGEQAFKSFLTEAVSKQMVAAGGLGLADALQRDMLKLQGLE
jgi:Rod binding domain-containing protein